MKFLLRFGPSDVANASGSMPFRLSLFGSDDSKHLFGSDDSKHDRLIHGALDR